MVLKTQGPPAGSAGYAGEESGGQCGGAQDTLSPKFLSLCMNHGMRGADVSLVSAEAQATSVRKPSKDHTWVTPGPRSLQKEEGGGSQRANRAEEPSFVLCRRARWRDAGRPVWVSGWLWGAAGLHAVSLALQSPE